MRSNFLLIFCLWLLAVSCNSSPRSSSNWMQPNGTVKVLSTIAMIDDLVRQIGGTHVDTTTLIKGELDPHSYQLVKGDDEKLSFADLIFFNGLGLEHGPSLQNYLSKNKKAIGLGDRIRQENPELILYYNGQIDPHIWMDISLWAKTVPFIVEALSEKDPAHASEYAERGKKILSQMAEQHRQIRDEMLQIPQSQRFLVTSHDAFNYFTRAYLAEENELRDHSWQKRFAAPEGLAPESQLSPAEIQFIIDYVAAHGIHMLFPESNVSKDSIKKILDAGHEKGLKLKMASTSLYADAMGKPGSDGDTYLKMIQHNANAIAQHLRDNHSN